MSTLHIIGRRSSLFTRMALIFAEELGVAYELTPIYDMTVLGAETYAGNPALKLPILRRGEGTLFGTQNICRAIAESAAAPANDVVWPEQLKDDTSRNAQELVWHGMSAQVQIVFGTAICKLPADNVFFTKARAGLDGSLQWLDSHCDQALSAMPSSRKLSIFEVSLFCLIEHLAWRKTMSMDRFSRLADFAAMYGGRPACQRTPYAFDLAPT
ncbi:MAG TPA: glutathione S-transferase N-terminal domain-containing protein [Steroidobacteraceae bacterium]|nr:glutathione S-transferase N-terminal domain-containing protein [Steroidobacteraceae bacterium]